MNTLLTNFFLCVFYSFIVWVVLPAYGIKGKRNKTRVYLILCFLQILFLYANVQILSMPDLKIYYVSLQEITSAPIDKIFTVELLGGKIEPGYRILMRLSSFVGNNLNTLLLINGGLLLYFYFKTIERYSPYAVISVLLFLLTIFHQSIYVIRQHLAMAIMVFSYTYIINRQQRKFLITCFIAFLLHQSAFLFLPVYYIYNFKTKKLLFFFLILGVGLTLFVKAVLVFFATEIERYNHYLDVTDRTYMESNWTPVAIVGVVLLSYVFVLKKHIFEDGINKIVLISLALGFIGYFASVGSSIPGRTFFYYTVSVIFSVPLTMSYIKTRLFKIAYSLSALTGYFFVTYVSEIEPHRLFELDLNWISL